MSSCADCPNRPRGETGELGYRKARSGFPDSWFLIVSGAKEEAQGHRHRRMTSLGAGQQTPGHRQSSMLWCSVGLVRTPRDSKHSRVAVDKTNSLSPYLKQPTAAVESSRKDRMGTDPQIEAIVGHLPASKFASSVWRPFTFQIAAFVVRPIQDQVFGFGNEIIGSITC